MKSDESCEKPFLRRRGPLLMAASILSVWSAVDVSAQLSLTLDPATVVLQPGTSGQVISILLQNSGTNYPVLGGTFYFEIDNGDSALGSAPPITGVTLLDITGNPFTSSNSLETPSSTDPEFWQVALEAQPPLPAVEIDVPGTSSFVFAQVTVDTTLFNTPGQSWSFKITSTTGGDPFFDIIDPTDPTNVISVPVPAVNGTVFIYSIPVPEAKSGMTLLGLAGWASFRAVRRRRVA